MHGSKNVKKNYSYLNLTTLFCVHYLSACSMCWVCSTVLQAMHSISDAAWRSVLAHSFTLNFGWNYRFFKCCLRVWYPTFLVTTVETPNWTIIKFYKQRILTKYTNLTTDLMNGVRFPTREKKLLSATTCRLTLGVHPASYLMGIGIFSPSKTTGPRTWPHTPSNAKLRIRTAILSSCMRLLGVAPGRRQVLHRLHLLFIPSNCMFLLFVLMDLKVQKHCHLMHVCMVSPYNILKTSYRWGVLKSKPCVRSHFGYNLLCSEPCIDVKLRNY